MSAAAIAESWAREERGLVHTVAAADLLTPVSAYLRLAAAFHAVPYRLLFESVEGGAARGRYSVIALCPDLVWRCHGGASAVMQCDTDIAPVCATGFVPQDGRPLDRLREIVADARMTLPEGMPPMVGGVFGYLGYDMVRQMEHLPNMPADDLDLPEGLMLRPGLFAIFDSVRDELVLAAPVARRHAQDTASEAYDRAMRLIARAEAALDAPLPAHTSHLPPGSKLAPPRSTMTREQFEDAVRRAKDYIAAGDAFQIVPSQRFSTGFDLPPLALYRALRRINPAPFLFLLDLGDFALVGSSPEILVRLRAGTITVRPLAGTRPRGATAAEDRALEVELLADEKERAEHLMLIDLGRNDVGRVARQGSVRVPEQFVIERYSHVMHISSTVEGTVADGVDALDALVAAFPAGTLTGAPKIRAMEIIDELEPTRRATYAGCIGYIGADGDMDTCIGLRMAVVKDGQMHVQAGCGVVADSVPELEYRETQQKARALFRAAEDAIMTAATKSTVV